MSVLSRTVRSRVASGVPMSERNARFAGMVVGAGFVGLMLLSACGSTAVDDGGNVNDNDNPIYGKVQKIDVDGTECVIYDADGGGGALSCDWGTP